MDFSNLLLSGADFHRKSLPGSSFQSAVLSNANFVEADLRGGIAHLDPSLVSLSFPPPVRSLLAGADLRGADLTRALFQGASFVGADLRGATLTAADLSGADLTGADLTGARLSQAILAGACLVETRLIDCDVDGVDLQGCDLSTAKLSGLRFICPTAESGTRGLRGLLSAHEGWLDLHGYGGRRLALPGLWAKGFMFHNRRLGLADLRLSQFESCDLRKTSFCESDLQNTVFVDCDLTGTDFRGSDLTNARFTRCRMIGTDFRRFHVPSLGYLDDESVRSTTMTNVRFTDSTAMKLLV